MPKSAIAEPHRKYMISFLSCQPVFRMAVPLCILTSNRRQFCCPISSPSVVRIAGLRIGVWWYLTAVLFYFTFSDDIWCVAPFHMLICQPSFSLLISCLFCVNYLKKHYHQVYPYNRCSYATNLMTVIAHLIWTTLITLGIVANSVSASVKWVW